MEIAPDLKPLYGLEMSGALCCEATVDNMLCLCFLDTGSGVSLISKDFVLRHKLSIERRAGPSVCTVSSEVFRMERPCSVFVGLLGVFSPVNCWVIDNFSFDILLGMDFSSKTQFLVDFATLSIVNPENGLCTTAALRTVSPRVSPNVKSQPTLSKKEFAELFPVVASDQPETVPSTEDPVCMMMTAVPKVSEEISASVRTADIDNNDNLEDREEMFSPLKAENAWLVKDFELSTLSTLDVGSFLTDAQRVALFHVLKNCSQAFPRLNDKLGHCITGVHKIDTGEARPISETLRRFSPWQIEEINRQITEMLEMNVISACESEWSSSIVLIRKKTSDIRLCLDWRKLNDVTKKFVYPVPDIQSLLDGF